MYLKTMNGEQDQNGEGFQVSTSMLLKLKVMLEAETFKSLAPALDR